MDIASIGIRIDATSATKATGELDKFSTAAGKADAAARKVGGGASQAGKAIDDTTRSSKSAAEAIKGFDIGLQGIGKRLALLGGAALAGGAISSLRSMVTESIAAGAALQRAADLSGVAAGEFSAIAAAAKAVGANLGDVSNAFRSIAVDVSKAAAGGREASASLKQLGLSADFLRTIKPSEQLEQIADALQRLPDASDRVRLGNDLLGSSYAKLAPLLEGGAAGLRRAREEQERLGNTFTGEELAKLKEAEAAIQRLGTAWDRFGNTLAVNVAPPLTGVLNTIDSLVSGDRAAKLREQINFLERMSGRSFLAVNYGDIGSGYFTSDEGAKKLAELKAQLEQLQAVPRAAQSGPAQSGIEETVAKIERGAIDGQKALERLRDSESASIKRSLELTRSQISNESALLQSARETGLVSEREYYAERRRLIEQDAEVQIRALEAENALLEGEKVAGAERLANREKIADNEARIAIIRARATTEVEVASRREAAAIASVDQAYQQATASVAEYLKNLSARYDRDLASRSQGSRQREINADRERIDADFLEQTQQLDRDRSAHPADITDEVYERRLAAIREGNQKAIAEHQRYWAELTALQGSATAGMMAAWRDYLDEASNVAGAVQGVFSRALGGMEDGLTRFVMNGKLDFKSLADSIIADLVRIQIRTMLTKIFGGILGAVGGSGGGMSSATASELTAGFSGGFASGGHPPVGRAALVGEKGPELIIPRSPVSVIPNHALGGGVVINQTLTPSPDMPVAQFEAVMQRFKNEARAEVYADMRRDRWRRVTG